MLHVGDAAPAFSAIDHNGKTHSLSGYAGQWVLLYFYPKDDTPGCTTEACALRDDFTQFKKIKAVVLGVSKDSAASHQKFAAKFDLPFPLLVDEDLTMIKAYGVWGKKKFMGKEFAGVWRISFLINPHGQVAKVYSNVKPAEHAAQVLADLKALQP
ncbi:thioredoxin-dependent thiol peroxidase [Candidatus Falkowbacteria bacterium]|nr:thioredoxin-dependent thiol peroxidase [Candidatus Falkowbacteria bacterium]